MGKRVIRAAIFAALVLFMLGCGLWQPYAAMQVLQPTQVPIPPIRIPTPPMQVPTRQPTRTATPTLQLCTVTAAEALNLRSGPGTSYPVIGWLQPGDMLTVSRRVSGWVSVISPAGAAGWVKSEYCK